jgi:hypothetical protein
MTVYLAFIAGLALGFVGHCAWSCLQAEPELGQVPDTSEPLDIWPRDARLALLRNDPDEHEELIR